MPGFTQGSFQRYPWIALFFSGGLAKARAMGCPSPSPFLTARAASLAVPRPTPCHQAKSFPARPMHTFEMSSNPPAITRVLVVEDDADDRDLLLRQLRKSGIDGHVKFIGDGKEALDFLLKLPPPTPFCDLIAIFLDLKLPSMNGVEMLRRIKKIPRVQNIPVIVMTSSLDPKDFEACQRLNVEAFIPKPITFEVFSKAITSLNKLSC
jgi:CheY-like chemotaxis protein